MLAQSPAQVPVKYVSVRCKGGLFAVLYGNMFVWSIGSVQFAFTKLQQHLRIFHESH